MHAPWHPALLAVVSAMALLVAQAPPRAEEATYKIVAVKGGGQLSGVISYEGDTLPPKRYQVTDAAKVCGARKEARTMRVSEDDALGDVVITLRGITAGKAPGDPPLIKVQQCELVPRIQGMMTGQRLTLKNLDDLPHRLSGDTLGGDTLFDFFQPMQGSKHRKLITQPGLVRVQAGEEMPWAQAWIYVASHPYVTVTDGEGRFSLTDIPPGSYELLAWHEVLGTRSAPVEIGAGQSQTLNLTFQGGTGSE